MTTTYLSPEVLATYTKYVVQVGMIPHEFSNTVYYMEFDVIAKDIFDARKDASELARQSCHGYWYITNIWK